MDQHYRGDIRVGREFTAARCVGNFIRKRRKQKLVADIYIDGGTRGSRICLVDKSEKKIVDDFYKVSAFKNPLDLVNYK